MKVWLSCYLWKRYVERLIVLLSLKTLQWKFDCLAISDNVTMKVWLSCNLWKRYNERLIVLLSLIMLRWKFDCLAISENVTMKGWLSCYIVSLIMLRWKVDCLAISDNVKIQFNNKAIKLMIDVNFTLKVVSFTMDICRGLHVAVCMTSLTSTCQIHIDSIIHIYPRWRCI